MVVRLMIGPRRVGFSQFGGLTGDLESGSRKRQGLAEARRAAQVSAVLVFLPCSLFSFFSVGAARIVLIIVYTISGDMLVVLGPLLSMLALEANLPQHHNVTLLLYHD